MLKAAKGNGSSFRFGISNNDISINDYNAGLFPCQAELAQRVLNHFGGFTIWSEGACSGENQSLARRKSRLKGGCSHDWLPHKGSALQLSLATGETRRIMPRSLPFLLF
jgi:hypothetical protein